MADKRELTPGEAQAALRSADRMARAGIRAALPSRWYSIAAALFVGGIYFVQPLLPVTTPLIVPAIALGFAGACFLIGRTALAQERTIWDGVRVTFGFLWIATVLAVALLKGALVRRFGPDGAAILSGSILAAACLVGGELMRIWIARKASDRR